MKIKPHYKFTAAATLFFIVASSLSQAQVLTAENVRRLDSAVKAPTQLERHLDDNGRVGAVGNGRHAMVYFAFDLDKDRNSFETAEKLSLEFILEGIQYVAGTFFGEGQQVLCVDYLGTYEAKYGNDVFWNASAKAQWTVEKSNETKTLNRAVQLNTDSLDWGRVDFTAEDARFAVFRFVLKNREYSTGNNNNFIINVNKDALKLRAVTP